MGGRCLCPVMIHKHEWQRLKKQAEDSENKPRLEKDNDVQASIELSQKWIRSWPDTVEGIVAKALNKKSEKTTDQVVHWEANIDEVREKNIQDRKVAVQIAKQKIFENSCYGRKLISALNQSHAMEARDLQIKFQNKLKQQAADIEKQMELKTVYFQLDKNEVDVKRKIKEKNLEYSNFNKAMTENQKKIDTKARELKKWGELEDARLMKKLLDYENEDSKRCDPLKKVYLEQCLADVKKRRDYQAKQEDIDARICAVWKKYDDKVRCGIKQTMNQIHMEKHNTSLYRQSYEQTRQIKEDEQRRYDEFIEKGIKQSERRAHEDQERDAEKQKLEKGKRCAIATELKIVGNYSQGAAEYDRSKCVCWRQSLFTKSKKDMKDPKNQVTLGEKEPTPASPFLTRSTRLSRALKERKLEPSPYSDTLDAHAFFDQQAQVILGQCRHKDMARKVIEGYRKYNNLP